MDLQQYIHHVGQAIIQQNGQEASNLLSLKGRHLTSDSNQLLGDLKSTFKPPHNNHSKAKFLGSLQGRLDSFVGGSFGNLQYSEVIAGHLGVVICVFLMGSVEDAYIFQSNAVTKFLQSLMSSNSNNNGNQQQSNWAIDILKVMCFDLRVVATQSEEKNSKSNNQSEGLARDEEASTSSSSTRKNQLEDAARLLNKCFTTTATDRSHAPNSKIWGALYVINQLFKIYFKLNNLRLCRNLIRAVGNPSFPPLERFPMGQRVTYSFYLGRLHMFNGEYQQADEQLSFALQHCHRDSRANKYLICLYLVPAKLLRGSLPSRKLMQKYRLREFEGIVAAIRSGDLKLFNASMEKHQNFFIGHGIYLILEKLRIITFRTFFKRIYHIKGTNKLPLRDFLTGLRVMGMGGSGNDDDSGIDKEELECILANMIFQSYIKGYISHEHGFLVREPAKRVPGDNLDYELLRGVLEREQVEKIQGWFSKLKGRTDRKSMEERTRVERFLRHLTVEKAKSDFYNGDYAKFRRNQRAVKVNNQQQQNQPKKISKLTSQASDFYSLTDPDASWASLYENDYVRYEDFKPERAPKQQPIKFPKVRLDQHGTEYNDDFEPPTIENEYVRKHFCSKRNFHVPYTNPMILLDAYDGPVRRERDKHQQEFRSSLDKVYNQQQLNMMKKMMRKPPTPGSKNETNNNNKGKHQRRKPSSSSSSSSLSKMKSTKPTKLYQEEKRQKDDKEEEGGGVHNGSAGFTPKFRSRITEEEIKAAEQRAKQWREKLELAHSHMQKTDLQSSYHVTYDATNQKLWKHVVDQLAPIVTDRHLFCKENTNPPQCVKCPTEENHRDTCLLSEPLPPRPPLPNPARSSTANLISCTKEDFGGEKDAQESLRTLADELNPPRGRFSHNYDRFRIAKGALPSGSVASAELIPAVKDTSSSSSAVPNTGLAPESDPSTYAVSYGPKISVLDPKHPNYFNGRNQFVLSDLDTHRKNCRKKIPHNGTDLPCKYMKYPAVNNFFMHKQQEEQLQEPPLQFSNTQSQDQSLPQLEELLAPDKKSIPVLRDILVRSDPMDQKLLQDILAKSP
eukprot:Nk52_evm7s230 gene=Nk52_evmTU7s230